MLQEPFKKYLPGKPVHTGLLLFYGLFLCKAVLWACGKACRGTSLPEFEEAGVKGMIGVGEMSISFEDILGKILLVGITYYTHDAQFIEQKQFWGAVISADGNGIKIKQSDGSILSLPPDLSSTKRAPLGEYRLRSTGEVVYDPDFLANWSSYKPKDFSN